MNNAENSVIYIITGGRNTGKTILCQKIIASLKASRLKISGILSPGVYQGQNKIGIYAENISSLERKLIARYSPGWDHKCPQREWQFNLKEIEWGNRVIEASIPTDILIIDELGYLEFEKNMGWTSAFSVIKTQNYHAAVVVIRPDLLVFAKNEWENAQILNIESIGQIDELEKYMLNQLLDTVKK